MEAFLKHAELSTALTFLKVMTFELAETKYPKLLPALKFTYSESGNVLVVADLKDRYYYE